MRRIPKLDTEDEVVLEYFQRLTPEAIHILSVDFHIDPEIELEMEGVDYGEYKG